MAADIETGWLIEKQPVDGDGKWTGGIVWWDGMGWTTVANLAIRYARKLDAERALHAARTYDGALAGRLRGAYVLEHQWGPAPAQAVG